MGVLDVVDRVLVRLPLGKLDVEVDADGMAAGGEEPARRVHADLGQELIEGDELAGPLRHRDLDAVAHEADPRHQDHLDRPAVEAHRFGRVPQPRHRPVVVGAPDVDEVVEAAAELLDDVADVGAEVGVVAVRLADHPVLVVPVVGRAEPEGAVLLVEVAGRAQATDGALDPALAIERALALPDVEAHAERRERGLDPGPDPLRSHSPTIQAASRPPPSTAASLPRLQLPPRRAGARRPGRGRRRPGSRLGDLHPTTDRDDRSAEVPHLGSEVVEVVLGVTSWPAASRTRQRRSPTKAPRALPMWRGPVGLAETNSTLTRRGCAARTRPQAPGSASTSATTPSRAASASRRLRKPGGATATEAMGEPFASAAAASSAAIASAIRRGGIR